MSAFQQLLAVLESLPRHFSAASPSSQASKQAALAVNELHALLASADLSRFPASCAADLDRYGTVFASDSCQARFMSHISLSLSRCCPLRRRRLILRPFPCRLLAAAAQSLSALAPAAARAMAQPLTAPPWLPGQVEAGCLALDGLSQLAVGTPHRLSAPTAFKLGAACSLVFGPGRTVMAGYLLTCAAGQMPPRQSFLLPDCFDAELAAVLAIAAEVLEPSRQRQAAAAFASSTARPSVLLPWLSTLTEALPLVLQSEPATGGATTGDLRLHAQLPCFH